MSVAYIKKTEIVIVFAWLLIAFGRIKSGSHCWEIHGSDKQLTLKSGRRSCDRVSLRK